MSLAINKPKKRKKKIKSAPEIGSNEFKQLQKEWYAKLADEGFEDIEHTVGTQTSHYFKKAVPTFPNQLTLDTTRGYYAMCERYLLNYQGLRGVDRFLWTHWSSGKTYAEILALHNAKYTKRLSIWSLYYRLQDLDAACKAWNTRSPHGYFNNGEDDGE